MLALDVPKLGRICLLLLWVNHSVGQVNPVGFADSLLFVFQQACYFGFMNP